MSVKLRWRKLPKGKKSAYLDIYFNGERKNEYLRIYIKPSDPPQIRKEMKNLADKIRIKRESQLLNNEYGFVSTTEKNKNFIQYYEQFAKNYDKQDYRKVNASLRKFKAFIGKDRLPMKKVTPLLCEQYAEYLTSERGGLNGDTPRNYWTKFLKVLKTAKKEKIIAVNPAEDIRFKTKNNKGVLKKNILTQDELQLIAKTHCGNEEIKKAFLFACFTGLGAAEIRKLTWSRIRNNKLVIYREKTGEQVVNDLHPVALQLIGESKSHDSKVFQELPSDNGINKCLKYWIERAGIDKKITFYCGRHTFATQLLLNGANLKTVADCLGHADTTHTMKYLNYVDSLKSKAISNLPNIKL